MTITSEQFNKLVTKDEHNLLVGKVDKMDEKMDIVLSAIDGLAKKVDNFQAESASNISAHDRFEVRISKLEGKEMMVRDEIE